jgi:hypothetical protein
MAADEKADAVESALAVARLEGALRDAGLRGERVAAAVKIADVSGLRVEGTEVSGIAEVVESLKEQSPEWFGANTRRYSAADATPENRDRSFRTASRREIAEELAEYGIKFYFD